MLQTAWEVWIWGLQVAVCSRVKRGKSPLIVMARCSLKINLLENNDQINLMKTKILRWAMLTLAVAALAGCGRNSSDENPPASTNSAGGQPMPGPAVSTNAVTPPGAPNPGHTHHPPATNP